MAIAFQKRYGDNTVANQTLQAILKGNFPDIWKQAKMFAPDKELVPVTKTWHLYRRMYDSFESFGKRYYGMWTLTHNSFDVGNANNQYKVSQMRLYDGADLKINSTNGYHGDDILPVHSVSHYYEGFGTGVELTHENGNQPAHEVVVNFVGFELADLPISKVQVVNIDCGFDINVYFNDVLQVPPITTGNNRSWLNVPLGQTVKILAVDPEKNIKINGHPDDYNDENPYTFLVTGGEILKNVFKGTEPLIVNFDESPYNDYIEISVDGGDFVPLAESFEYTEGYVLKGIEALIAATSTNGNMGFSFGDDDFFFGNDWTLVVDSESLAFGVSTPIFFEVINRLEDVELSLVSFTNSGFDPVGAGNLIIGLQGGTSLSLTAEDVGLPAVSGEADQFFSPPKFIIDFTTGHRPISAAIVINGIDYGIVPSYPFGSDYVIRLMIPPASSVIIDSVVIQEP